MKSNCQFEQENVIQCHFRASITIDNVVRLEPEEHYHNSTTFRIENQNGAIAVHKVYGESALLVLN